MIRAYGLSPLMLAVLAAVLYQVGGWEALGGTIPLLLITLAVSWSYVVFLNHLASPYLFLARETRLTVGLEFALFWWWLARDQANRSDYVMPHLRRARAAARDPVLRSMIDRFMGLTAGKNSAEAAALVVKLRSALEDREDPAPRSPYLRHLVPPAGHITSAALVITFVYALWALLNRPDGLDGIDLLVSLVVLLLSREALLFLHALALRIHMARAKARFRTLIVSDVPSEHLLNGLAGELYWRVGQVVALFVGPAARESWLHKSHDGSDYFSLGPDDLDAALEIFSGRTDLLVIHTQDPPLAARVRAAVELPADRCLALSEHGAAPPGFLWLDSSTLMMDPAKVYAPTLGARRRNYYWRRLPGAYRSDNWWLWGMLAGCGALLWVEGSLLLIVLLILSAFSLLLQRQLGHLRRSIVSAGHLRVSRAEDFSLNLRPKTLSRLLAIGSIALTLGAWAIIFFATGVPADDLTRIFGFLALGVAVPASLFATAQGLQIGGLRAVKWFLDWNFRIVIFRRNSGKFGYAHKSLVMAPCGKYGQVILVNDKTLEGTKQGYGEWREEHEGPWLEVFSEMDKAIEVNTLRHDWKGIVLRELLVADFAVFDWSEDITENMEWELQRALESLPPQRIMIVINEGLEQRLGEVLSPLGHEVTGKLRQIKVPRDPDDQYAWPSNAEFAATFQEKLHTMMAALRPEARVIEAKLEQGAWPLPD